MKSVGEGGDGSGRLALFLGVLCGGGTDELGDDAVAECGCS